MKKLFLFIFLVICANFIFGQGNPASFSKVTCPIYKIPNSTVAPSPSASYLYSVANHLYWGTTQLDAVPTVIDTTHLSDRINLKQNISDTLTKDATRYWVDLQNYQHNRENIKYFIEEGGIRNNSGIDNTSVLNSLISDLSQRNGGIIIFDTGDYYFNGTVILKPGVSLIGIGTGTPVGFNREINLYHDPTIAGTNFIEYDTTDIPWGYNVNTSIENLSINGSATSHIGIYFMKAYRANVKDVYVNGFDENITIYGMMVSRFQNVHSFQSRTTGLHVLVPGILGINTSTVFDQCYFGHTTDPSESDDNSRPIIFDPASAQGFDFYSCAIESAEKGVLIGTRNFINFYALLTENIPHSNTATSVFEIGKDTTYKVYAGLYNFIGGHLAGRNGVTPYGTSIFDVDYCGNMKVDGVQFGRIDSVIKLTANSHGITFSSCGQVQINAGMTECNRLNSYNLVGNFNTGYNIDIPNYLKVISDPVDTVFIKRAAIVGNDTISPTAVIDVNVGTYGSFLPETSDSAFLLGLRVHDAEHYGNVTLDMGVRGSSNPTLSWIQSRIDNNYSRNRPLFLNPNGGSVHVGVINPKTLNGDTIVTWNPLTGEFQYLLKSSIVGSITPLIYWTANGNDIYKNNSGNVAIGTTSPTSSLNVNVTSYGAIPPAASGSANFEGIRIDDVPGAVSLDMGIRGNAVPTYSWIQSRVNNNYSADQYLMLNPNGGNVGINTTNAPATALDVSGTVTATALNSGTHQVGGWNGLTTSGTSLYIGNNSGWTILSMPYGNVGIGTTAPQNLVHAKGTIRAGGTIAYATLDSVNAIRLYGNSTVWDDLMFPFTTGHRGSNPTPAFNADSLWYGFSGGTDTTSYIMYITVQMPHKWADGVDSIYPHIHYHHTTAQGTPTFRVRYKWFNIGSTTGTWKYCTLSTTTATDNNTHQMSYAIKNISSSGKTISSILLCQIYLVSQTGTGGIDAYQFDIHYPINSMGSNTSTAKD